MIDHVYAGARFKHDDTEKATDLWVKDINTWYFDLMDTYQDKIILEIAGHDHF